MISGFSQEESDFIDNTISNIQKAILLFFKEDKKLESLVCSPNFDMTENDYKRVSDEEILYCKNLFADHDFEEDDWRIFFTIEGSCTEVNPLFDYISERLNMLIPDRHFIAYADSDNDYDRITIEEFKG